MVMDNKDFVSGVVSNAEVNKDYTGENTSTAEVIVDNNFRQIRVNVDISTLLGETATTAYPGYQGKTNRNLILDTQESLNLEISRAKSAEKSIEQEVVNVSKKTDRLKTDIDAALLDYADKQYVYEKITEYSKLSKQVVDNVDTSNNTVTINGNIVQPLDGILYLLKEENSNVEDIYKEYTLIDNILVLIGDTSTDLRGYATEKWVKEQNYLTEHQDLTEYATKTYTQESVGASEERLFSFIQEEKNKLNNYVTPEMFGAVGDGVSDDTAAIQAALDSGAGHVLFNDKTYLVNGTHVNTTDHSAGGIFPHSNTTLMLSPKTVIKHPDSISGYYNIFNLLNVTNVSIIGGNIEGGAFTGEYSGSNTGEFGYGIIVSNSDHILIKDVHIYNCSGDAIILQTYNNPNENCNRDVKIENCHIHNCRRQGISLVNCQGVVVDGCHIHDIYGTAPKSGIDVECGSGNFKLKDIFIKNCNIHDTENSSIILSLNCETVDISNSDVESINAIDCDYATVSNVVCNSIIGRCKDMFLYNVKIKGSLYSSSDNMCVHRSTAESIQITSGRCCFNDCYFPSLKQILLSQVVSDPKMIESVEFNRCTIHTSDDQKYVIRTDSTSQVNSILFSDCSIVYADTKGFTNEQGNIIATEFCNACWAKMFVLRNCKISFKECNYQFTKVSPASMDCYFCIDNCNIIAGSKLSRFILCDGKASLNLTIVIKNNNIVNYTNILNNYTGTRCNLVCNNNIVTNVTNVVGVTGVLDNTTVYQSDNIII